MFGFGAGFKIEIRNCYFVVTTTGKADGGMCEGFPGSGRWRETGVECLPHLLPSLLGLLLKPSAFSY